MVLKSSSDVFLVPVDSVPGGPKVRRPSMIRGLSCEAEMEPIASLKCSGSGILYCRAVAIRKYCALSVDM